MGYFTQNNKEAVFPTNRMENSYLTLYGSLKNIIKQASLDFISIHLDNLES